MYFTHHFAHHETLNRAHSWLARLGFSPDQLEARTEGVLRLSVTAPAAQLTEVRRLIDAIELTDPDGFPSFWNETRRPHGDAAMPAATRPAAVSRPQTTPIGWHPDTPAPLSDGPAV